MVIKNDNDGIGDSNNYKDDDDKPGTRWVCMFNFVTCSVTCGQYLILGFNNNS